jgi:anti-anti-sigma factor
MSLYNLSHPWDVQEVPDGLRVRITPRDLDVHTLSIFTDECLELALENDLPRLYLDFGKVNILTSVVLGKLVALDRRLHQVGGRLVLCNLNGVLQQLFRAVNWQGDGTPEGPP